MVAVVITRLAAIIKIDKWLEDFGFRILDIKQPGSRV